MGVLRKTLSISTGGLVDFRSEEERIARNTRFEARAARRAAAELRRQAELAARGIASAAPGGELPPPGWHEDPLGGHRYRYWNGFTWTERVSDSRRSSSGEP